jgi:hypothetical protein
MQLDTIMAVVVVHHEHADNNADFSYGFSYGFFKEFDFKELDIHQ